MYTRRGNRACGYFSNLFVCRKAKSVSNKARIELNAISADSFPLFLDYINGLDEDIPFKSIN